MAYNLLNGGLILKCPDGLIISDMNNFTTNIDLNGMFWFMNCDGTCIYYSDQRYGNYLCKWDLHAASKTVILERPCYLVTLYNDWIYYIDESDYKLYRCMLNGKNNTRIVHEEINCFVIEEGKLMYSTQTQIKICDINGNYIEKVFDAHAASMIFIDGIIAFADKNNQHVLTLLDTNTMERIVIPDVSVSFMNTDGQYLFCSNAYSEKNIFRVSLSDGKIIRMCNESAEYLHIIDGSIYYSVHGDWYRMNISGGQAIKL